MPARKTRYGKFGTVDPTKPMFVHDSDCCVFLGHYHDSTFSMCSERRAFDLYWCEQGGDPTVLARYSDDGPDYFSGIGMGIPPLNVAEDRAVARGLRFTRYSCADHHECSPTKMNCEQYDPTA